MANQSKTKDPRFWQKWRGSGAVGTIEEAVLRTMQRDRKQRLVYVKVNESAGVYDNSHFNKESKIYKPSITKRKHSITKRPKFYSYGTDEKLLFGSQIPYAFQIESVPGVGKVVFRQGGISVSYSQEGKTLENPQVANVAGMVVSETQKANKYGAGFVPVALFDPRKDRGLVKKIKDFLREKSVSGYIAFQS